ncbi:MAG TPA: hypothetical protein DFR83_15770, partial [Deltaproteobacteria bacterium]|nr:hypothetical protein [Deltaproteobacteria bacterium]
MSLPGPSRSAGRFDSALDNLVRQFARPLDCLRELVQNSIDAGSPRVEISLGYTAREECNGTLAISIRDFGEGMDEHVIDHELTRMFASSKAGDLTKIGRFGIGFTSVFAIGPEAVHVRTGRHGSGWELIFHPDRSFHKIRVEEPVRGTSVTLYKHITSAQRSRWQRDIEGALSFWCEHCSIPVVFDDTSLGLQSIPRLAPSSQSSDPFAAFATTAPPPVRTITRPLDLPDAEWTVHHCKDGIDILAGISKTPTYRWYNGGLTLLSTTDPACLGPHEQRLGFLSFKVQSR